MSFGPSHAVRRPLWRGGLVLAAVLLIVLVVGLTIAARTPGHSAPPASASPERVVGTPAPAPLSDAPHALAPAAASAARAFFLGYLAYVAGHATASQIPNAAPQVLAALGVRQLPASPAKVHAAVLMLGAREAAGPVLHVTGLVSDGIQRYPIRIVMVHEHAGWKATQMASAE